MQIGYSEVASCSYISQQNRIVTSSRQISAQQQNLRPSVKAKGILGNIFKRKDGVDDKAPSKVVEKIEALSPSAQDFTRPYDKHEGEVVLSRVESDDGSVAQIVYRTGSLIDAEEYNMLGVKAGWGSRDMRKVRTALENSFIVASVHLIIQRADGNDTERMIGSARATSDHVFNATIWDVVVDPEYQGQGLGKTLVEQVTRSLIKQDIQNITLFADKNVTKFYENMGFTISPDGVKGMFWEPK